jgi:hypothetical protein
MSQRTAPLRILVLLVLAFSPALAQKNLTTTEAKDHIGEKATVCGKLVSTHWAKTSRGSPTFLNFDQPYPNQIFTVVIWGTDRSKFSESETAYQGKQVCATGKIAAFRGTPEIVAHEPSQITVR